MLASAPPATAEMELIVGDGGDDWLAVVAICCLFIPDSAVVGSLFPRPKIDSVSGVIFDQLHILNESAFKRGMYELFDAIKAEKLKKDCPPALRGIRVPGFDRNSNHTACGTLPSFYSALKGHGYCRPDRYCAVFVKKGDFEKLPDENKSTAVFNALRAHGKIPKVALKFITGHSSSAPSAAAAPGPSPTSIIKTGAVAKPSGSPRPNPSPRMLFTFDEHGVLRPSPSPRMFECAPNQSSSTAPVASSASVPPTVLSNADDGFKDPHSGEIFDGELPTISSSPSESCPQFGKTDSAWAFYK